MEKIVSSEERKRESRDEENECFKLTRNRWVGIHDDVELEEEGASDRMRGRRRKSRTHSISVKLLSTILSLRRLPEKRPLEKSKTDECAQIGNVRKLAKEEERKVSDVFLTTL